MREYEHKYLHLQVREADGRVIGIVDVIMLVCSTAGNGSSGGKGWRDFFSGAMAVNGDNDRDTDSDSGSNHSGSLRVGGQSKASTTTSAGTATRKEGERPVSKLRPKLASENILDAAKKMALNCVDAAVLRDAEGTLSGIITDNDVTRRVIVVSLVGAETLVSTTVMTKNPSACSLRTLPWTAWR